MSIAHDATPPAIIGLGYVGLPLAVEFDKRRPVIGFDINPARITDLRQGRDRTREVAALRAATIFIVTGPMPIDAHQRPVSTAT